MVVNQSCHRAAIYIEICSKNAPHHVKSIFLITFIILLLSLHFFLQLGNAFSIYAIMTFISPSIFNLISYKLKQKTNHCYCFHLILFCSKNAFYCTFELLHSHKMWHLTRNSHFFCKFLQILLS